MSERSRIYLNKNVIENKKMELNERKLIFFLEKKYGYEPKELQNNHFKQHGYLKTGNNSYNNFKKKIDSVCENWERLPKGKGEPVVYVLYNVYKRANPIPDERINNTGRPTSDDELIMEEYILYKLSTLKNRVFQEGYAISKWGQILDLIYFWKMNTENAKEELKSELSRVGYWEVQREKAMLDYQVFSNRRIMEIVERSFNRLSNKGKIEYKWIPMALDTNNNPLELTPEHYEELKTIERGICEQFNVSLFTYHNYPKAKKSINAKAAFNKILKSHDLKSYFKGHKVTLIKPTEERIDFSVFKDAYLKRFIHLVEAAQNRDKYKNNEQNIEKKFYAFSMILNLKCAGFDVDVKLIEQYTPCLEEMEVFQSELRERLGDEYHEKRVREFMEASKEGRAFGKPPSR